LATAIALSPESVRSPAAIEARATATRSCKKSRKSSASHCVHAGGHGTGSMADQASCRCHWHLPQGRRNHLPAVTAAQPS
jgi:hypothetical protein